MKENGKKRSKGKKAFAAGGLSLVLFLVWTVLIQVADVQPIGPDGSSVGFALWNGWFHRLTGVHMFLYTITDWLGLVPIGVCMIFAGIGFVQWIRRRTLFQVDPDILILGVYYVIVIGAYLVFEMFTVNYRPVLIEGRLEASYPSSTTLLVLCVMPTLIEQAERRMKQTIPKRWIKICTVWFSVFMVLGRLISGVHWFTDIVGAVILSLGLFCLYKAAVLRAEQKKQG